MGDKRNTPERGEKERRKTCDNNNKGKLKLVG